jgi:uncharacterized RDD family membrane protein YckC
VLVRSQPDGGAIEAPEVPAESGREPRAQPNVQHMPAASADVATTPASGASPASALRPAAATDAARVARTEAVLAGWWRRLAAFAIDCLILTIVTGALWGRLLASFANRMSQAVVAQAHPARGAHGAIGRVFGQTIAPYLIVLVPTIIIAIVYYWLLTGYWGTTIGKRAVGTWVVRAEDSSVIGLPRAFLRAVIFVVGGEVVPLFFLIDNLWLLWDPRRQALHDKAARTLVVRQPPRTQLDADIGTGSQSTRQ